MDFLSIGTNDLLQYLFAADRLNADVAGIPDVFDPDVLRLVASVCAAAAEHGAWVGVCGEAAAEPRAAAAFVALGVTELSMTPNAVQTTYRVASPSSSGAWHMLVRRRSATRRSAPATPAPLRYP
ncbi:MAG: putative PEP-binding protein [Egibacteraceae bacterium]